MIKSGFEGPGSSTDLGEGQHRVFWRRPRAGENCNHDGDVGGGDDVDCEEEEDLSSFRFQVTIFGESAGGWSVSQQVVSKKIHL